MRNGLTYHLVAKIAQGFPWNLIGLVQQTQLVSWIRWESPNTAASQWYCKLLLELNM